VDYFHRRQRKRSEYRHLQEYEGFLDFPFLSTEVWTRGSHAEFLPGRSRSSTPLARTSLSTKPVRPLTSNLRYNLRQ
jgi:hypothetical protein